MLINMLGIKGLIREFEREKFPQLFYSVYQFTLTLSQLQVKIRRLGVVSVSYGRNELRSADYFQREHHVMAAVSRAISFAVQRGRKRIQY